jgi:hypothetical protein
MMRKKRTTMSKMTKLEGMEMCLERGITKESAERFMDGRPIMTKGVQLPPEHALTVMNQLAEIGMFAGPIRFYVMLAEDDEAKLEEIIASTGHEIIREEGLGDPANLKDAIAAGYKGSQGLEGLDKSKLN